MAAPALGATDAERVLALVAERPPTLGAGRLVCVDGPAGSGKTTLAGDIASLSGAPVVHLDDLYEGWTGLDRVDAQLATVLRPLVKGRAAHYRRWDWHTDTWADTVTVSPTPLLVVEGVGAGSRAVADLVTVLVWVEAPAELRLARGLARDGDGLAEHWRRWMSDEQEHLVRERTRERADVRLDGTGTAT